MRKMYIPGALLFLFVLPSYVAAADSAEPVPGDYQVSRQVIEKTMANLVSLMKTTELPDDEQGRKDTIKELVTTNLAPVIDFKRIVKRIMGKYFADASKKQRNAFLDSFRNSLVNTYGQYLIGSDLKSIADRLKYRVLPLGKQRIKGISSVNCIISFDGKQYQVTFSMYYNSKQEKWLMDNIIVEGINLGINYRTQFDRLMVSYQRDYDKVIAEWATVDGSS